MMKRKNTTYSDIAQYTSLSKMTISRYFNQPDTLAEDTRKKIALALQELNYSENKFAKALASGRSNIIGIITPTFFYNFHTAMVDTFIRNYPKCPYKFMIFINDDSMELERRYIDELLSYRIEGLIILSNALSSKELSQYPIPVVGIEREDQYISSVNTDNAFGTRQAIKRLLKDGCTALAHINIPTAETLPAYDRIRIFEECAQKAKVPHEYYFAAKDMLTGHTRIHEHFVGVCQSLLEKFPGQRVGVFVSNDNIASLFLNSALSYGIRIPEQFEIIGFDNSPISVQSIMPITTIGQNVNRLVGETIKLLSRQWEESRKNPDIPLEPEHLVIRPKIILRDTTKNSN